MLVTGHAFETGVTETHIQQKCMVEGAGAQFHHAYTYGDEIENSLLKAKIGNAGAKSKENPALNVGAY
jgi:citrate lyase alpha subunit